MTERLRVVLTALLFLAAAVSTASGTDPICLETGDGRFVFRDPPQFTGKNVPVWYFKPEAYLRRTPEAMEQGSNRLARGKLYFETTRRKAGAMGTPFAWRLVFVPDVGHSNAGIAPMAAKLVREAFKTRR